MTIFDKVRENRGLERRWLGFLARGPKLRPVRWFPIVNGTGEDTSFPHDGLGGFDEAGEVEF